jgi:ABC-2 type transport system permease protein
MIDLIASEWIKVRTLRSVWWALGLTAAAVVASAAIDGEGAFPLAGYLVLLVVATSSGAATMIGEYSSGLVRATSVAVPARSAVVLAKAAVITMLWLVAGSVIAAGSYAVASPERSVGVAEWLGAILVAPVCALIGLGLAVLLRHGGAAYVTGVLLMVAVPQLLSGDQATVRAVHHAMIVPAWQRLTLAYGDPAVVGEIYTTVTTAWLAYLLWPVAVLGAALVVHRTRDI